MIICLSSQRQTHVLQCSLLPTEQHNLQTANRVSTGLILHIINFSSALQPSSKKRKLHENSQMSQLWRNAKQNGLTPLPVQLGPIHALY